MSGVGLRLLGSVVALLAGVAALLVVVLLLQSTV
jgi:hypothetical protein